MGMAKLPIHASFFEELFQLSEGYSIMGGEYDPFGQIFNLHLASDKLPATPEGSELLTVQLHMLTEQLADHPDFRRLTMEVKLP